MARRRRPAHEAPDVAVIELGDLSFADFVDPRRLLALDVRDPIGARALARPMSDAARLQTLEEELAALEEEGAKADQKKKVKDAAEKDMAAIRKNADETIAKYKMPPMRSAMRPP